jgi:hypothetical protein
MQNIADATANANTTILPPLSVFQLLNGDAITGRKSSDDDVSSDDDDVMGYRL